MIYTSVGI